MAEHVSKEWLLENGVDPALLDRLLAEPPRNEPGVRVGSGLPTCPVNSPSAIERLTTGRIKALAAIATVQVSLVKSGPGRWIVSLSGWSPASKNLKSKGHWTAWHRARKADNAAIALIKNLAGGPPPATGKRRVSLIAEKRTAANLPDPQNIEESFFDALKCNKLIIDDSAKYLDAARAVVLVSKSLSVAWRTTVTIQDIEP